MMDDDGLAFLRTKLKIGEYDGADIMHAWIALDELMRLRREVESLRAAVKLGRDALAGGLWDYGPGQDEHARCDEVIAELDAVIAARKPTAPAP